MVVDRLLVKPGIEKRLEASIETATKLADGLVLIAVVNGRRAPVLAETGVHRSAAPACRSSSRGRFRSTARTGRARTCHGLGSIWTFDPAKVIVDPSKPLLDGGLGPGAGSWYMQQELQELARKARINLKKPFEELPAKAQTVLLEGANGLPGILEILQQSFESSTEGYREWLTEYMSPVECPACHGQAAARPPAWRCG